MRNINENTRQEILNVLEQARTLAEKIDDLLRHADFMGSEATGRDAINETLACIVEDINDANNCDPYDQKKEN